MEHSYNNKKTKKIKKLAKRLDFLQEIDYNTCELVTELKTFGENIMATKKSKTTFLESQGKKIVKKSNKATLPELKKLVNFFADVSEDITVLEEQLKIKKEELRIISGESIPALLLMSGLSEIKLDNGKKVIVKDKV